MSDEYDKVRPPLNFDETLMSNARLASHYYDTELRFSGYDTPQVLFSGVHGKGAKIRLEKDRLNPNNSLMWFTPTLKLAGTFGEKLDDTKSNAETRLILVVFPHESTDLGKWVYQETPGKQKPILEFITNNDIPLDQAVVTTLSNLLIITSEQQRTIKTKGMLLQVLNETNIDQQKYREELKNKLANQ